MRSPEQRMFLNVITQAVHDAAYKGYDRYYEYHRDQAIAWLTSNSQDFRTICVLADLDPDYTYLKMTKAIKSDINNYVETIIKNKNQNERIVLVVID